MNIIQVEELLKSLGWSVHVDEVGDKFAQFTLGDRIVDIIYGNPPVFNGASR